jgi:hypothetical protein
MYKITSHLIPISMICALLSACGPNLPRSDKVETDFHTDYPNAELVGVSIGEGPRESAYVHYHFKPEGSVEVNKVVWTYARNDSGGWEVTKKAKPLLPLD